MDLEKRNKLYEIQKKIDFYAEVMMNIPCPYVRNYYARLIKDETDAFGKLLNERMDIQKQFTIEELSKYDGTGNNPAYAAVNGIVYDLSLSKAWGGGTHFGLYAGKDLTGEFNRCHKNSESILKDLPKVGILK